jgi:hypothetical protein
MIDMQELETAWKGLEQRLVQQDLRLEALQRQGRLQGIRARLRWLTLGQVPQIVIGALVVLWAGGYWTSHWGETHLVVYGIAIHLYGIGLLGASLAQVVLLAGIDFQAPVLAVQRQLQSLALLRVRAERGLLLAGFLVWLPILLVAMRALGLDLWQSHPENVAWNLAASVLLMLAVGWLTLRFRAGFERDAVGGRLREALAELDAFENPRD